MTSIIQGTYSYQVCGDKRTVVLERWLSHYDHLNVLPNDPNSGPSIYVRQLKLPVTLSIGDPMLSSGIYKSGMHSHRHTDKPKTKDF